MILGEIMINDTITIKTLENTYISIFKFFSWHHILKDYTL